MGSFMTAVGIVVYVAAGIIGLLEMKTGLLLPIWLMGFFFGSMAMAMGKILKLMQYRHDLLLRDERQKRDAEQNNVITE